MKQVSFVSWFPFFVWGEEDLRYHHSVIHDGTHQTSHDLDGKCVSWRQMNILRQLEITCEQLAHLHCIVGEASEVEVGERFSGEPGTYFSVA